jgi:outer membrane protein, adhesin transport system
MPPWPYWCLIGVMMLVLATLLLAASVSGNAEQAPVAATGDEAWLAALAARPAADFPARLRVAADALPAVNEGREGLAIADAQTRQARSRLFPVLGVDVNSADTLARDFQRQSTQFESLVPRQRTDAIGSVNQLLADWGATSARIRAGQAAAASARARYELARTDAMVALLAAWHEAIAANTALELSRVHAARLDDLARLVTRRADAGAESQADRARAEASAAQAQARFLEAQRRDASAHARLAELWGPLPAQPARALPPPSDGHSVEPPEVRAARADARARAAAAQAAKSDRLPRVEARVSGSAFDVTGAGRPDYDVRATLSLSTRFSIGGGEAARVAELSAQARQAEFAASRLNAENARELAEAEADLAARTASLPAQRRSAQASFQARYLFGLRFTAARGTLFDLLAAEREALEAGLALVDAEIRLDMARWLILARRGTLLDVVDGPGAGRAE